MHNRKLWKEAQKNTEKSRKSASFYMEKMPDTEGNVSILVNFVI